MVVLCVGLSCCLLYTIEYDVNTMIQWIIHANMWPYDTQQSIIIEFIWNNTNMILIQGITLVIVRCYVFMYILCKYTNYNYICKLYYVKLILLQIIISVMSVLGMQQSFKY